jgi:6-phosphofructokinase 1
MLHSYDLSISSLGKTTFTSPLEHRQFISDGKVLLCATLQDLNHYLAAGQEPPAFEQAGPRATLFFDPKKLQSGNIRCGIVTCGGLCPGINDVIRSVVLTLTYAYGVKTIYGFRYGYAGLAAKNGFAPLVLTPDTVSDIHTKGGTFLGSSRGPQAIDEMVDTLESLNVGMLFAIGGDGTLRAASTLAQEISKRALPISVVGIPKTIDNDLMWIERSFGFATAAEEAMQALNAAHEEARGAYNGIGLVKLMGRHSGFITAQATLANSDVNFCLVPEVPFTLDGFLRALEKRITERHHAVIALAEGAAQDILAADPKAKDASGNIKLKDVGVFLRDAILQYFNDKHLETTVKYIDPSYMIRSVPANALDSEYCLALGQHAVHAGMAGRTDMMVGYWNQHFTHVPLSLATAKRKKLEPQSDLWQRVLSSTGQASM